MQLLGHAGLRRILANHRPGGSGITLEIEDDVEIGLDADSGGLGTRRKRRAKAWKNRFPPVPNAEGRRLMDDGVFGVSEYYKDRRVKRKTRLARKLMSREQGQTWNDINKSASAISQVDPPVCSFSSLLIDEVRKCYLLQMLIP